VSVNDTVLGEEGRLVRDTKTYYPGDILTLHLEIRHETDTRLRVRVRGAANYDNFNKLTEGGYMMGYSSG